MYLPPVVVCSGEEEEDLPLLHPDFLSLLRDVLEVVVDHDEDLPIPLLHPDPHPDYCGGQDVVRTLQHYASC